MLWAGEAEQRLAALWNKATNRQAITTAADAIDKQLNLDLETVGESRPDGTRILLVPPLGILFTVTELDRIVSVLTVWLYKKRT